jgi:hypothetical protein
VPKQAAKPAAKGKAPAKKPVSSEEEEEEVRGEGNISDQFFIISVCYSISFSRLSQSEEEVPKKPTPRQPAAKPAAKGKSPAKKQQESEEEASLVSACHS